MAAHRFQPPGACTVLPASFAGRVVGAGDVVDLTDEQAQAVVGWYGPGALVPVRDPSVAADDAREDQPAPDFPDVGGLSAADVHKLAKALGYDGPRRKAEALAYLQTLDADRVRAALEG